MNEGTNWNVHIYFLVAEQVYELTQKSRGESLTEMCTSMCNKCTHSYFSPPQITAFINSGADIFSREVCVY